MATKHWLFDHKLRRLNVCLFGMTLSGAGLGYDAALINTLLASHSWFADLNLDWHTSLFRAVIASQLFGSLISLGVAAFLADYIGRQRAILCACLLLVGSTLGQAFVTSATQFLGLRLLSGFGLGINLVASNTLISEIGLPRQRAQITALSSTFFYIGSVSAAWSGYAALTISSDWTWRLPVILQALWPLVEGSIILFCPESPRWLILHDKSAQARSVLAKYYGHSMSDADIVESEYHDISTALELERRNDDDGWLAFFRRRNLQRTFIIVFLGLTTQWVGNGIISYYLSPVLATVGITSPRRQLIINGGLQIFNLILATTGAMLSDTVGRRSLLLASALGMLISLSIVAGCSAAYETSSCATLAISVIVFIFFFFGSYDFGFTPIPTLYVTELVPTMMRARAVNLYYTINAVALCFNQYVNPLALEALSWRYYLVFIGVLVIVLAVTWLFAPETKGIPLEEAANILHREKTPSPLSASGQS
nr:lactose permease [Quercus suber]